MHLYIARKRSLSKTHLYKVINHREGYDDDGEGGCGQTDDEERPDNAQKTENPGAETLREGLVHREDILQHGKGTMHHGSFVEFCGALVSSFTINETLLPTLTNIIYTSVTTITMLLHSDVTLLVMVGRRHHPRGFTDPYVLADPPCVHRKGWTCASQKC